MTASVLLATVARYAQSGQAQSILPDFTHAPGTFPKVIAPYREIPIPPLVAENSPRIRDLIHNRKLELSLADALALVIENNLNIATQRYLRPIAQTDLLRTQSGQAARGIPNATLPSGLSVGALGVGVNQFQGAGGVGSAGGISGGGGAVQVPQAGSFDPSISFNSSWDRTVAPLNSVQVAGVPRVTTYSTAFTGSYTQMLPDGSSFLVALNGIRQSSTQQFLLYNPAIISRFAFGFNQPLLNGFGMLPNRRFIMVASNNLNTSDTIFRQQIATIVVQVENAYWDIAASRQAIAAAKGAVDAAKTLQHQAEVMKDIGNGAELDVLSAQSSMAAAERDLIIAETNYQLQQTQLKAMLTKKSDPELDAAEIETTDSLPEPTDADLPDLQQTLELAFRERPDLQVAQQGLRNQDITVRFTQNGLLPATNLFGLYAGSGLAGNTLQTPAGASDSLGQDITGQFPEYAGGLSVTLPIRNRSAQADNLRARLESRQFQVNLESLRMQVSLEVRQAVIGLTQGKAQVEAAHEALRLAEQTVFSERKKLEVGISTSYNVILRERDLLTAQLADIASTVTYAKSLVELDRARGTTLNNNGITLGDALSGEITHRPTPPLRYPRYQGVQPVRP